MEEEEEKKTNPDYYSIPAEEREREKKKTNLLVEFPVVFVLLFIPLTIRFCAFAPVLHLFIIFRRLLFSFFLPDRFEFGQVQRLLAIIPLTGCETVGARPSNKNRSPNQTGPSAAGKKNEFPQMVLYKKKKNKIKTSGKRQAYSGKNNKIRRSRERRDFEWNRVIH